jgi:hypothetical protein
MKEEFWKELRNYLEDTDDLIGYMKRKGGGVVYRIPHCTSSNPLEFLGRYGKNI